MRARHQYSVLTNINDELDDLKTGDPFLPPDADSASTLEVVPVHNNVNQQIDGDRNPLHRSQTDQLGIAQEGGSTMVVGVKESQRLLLEEEEDGVNEFEVFGQVVQLREVMY